MITTNKGLKLVKYKQLNFTLLTLVKRLFLFMSFKTLNKKSPELTENSLPTNFHKFLSKDEKVELILQTKDGILTHQTLKKRDLHQRFF